MMRALLVGTLLLATAACGDEPRRARPFAAAAECGNHEMGCPRPIFAVASLRDELAYYRDQLGFQVDWEWGEPADFASVSRSETTIFLGESPHGGYGALWVSAKDVDKLHAELKQRGARIEMAPTNMPWGSREMHVRDRDGNLLRFAGPTR
ncbi:MAG TPA: glyoxalase superfamily protein [Kofleriaceae bacterium]|nr:glyoxalase superfamily protein [Kofleriaceae bacterium]